MDRIDSLIIDTNLLLLLIIGNVDGGIHICKSNRLQKFNIDDFQKVASVVSKTKNISITPYIATEVSNLIDLKGVLRNAVMEEARAVFGLLNPIPVVHMQDIGGHFIEYGITDNSLISLVNDYTILTDDERMAYQMYRVKPENVVLFAQL